MNQKELNQAISETQLRYKTIIAKFVGEMNGLAIMAETARSKEGLELYEHLEALADREYDITGDVGSIGDFMDVLKEQLGLDEDGLELDEAMAVRDAYEAETGVTTIMGEQVAIHERFIKFMKTKRGLVRRQAARTKQAQHRALMHSTLEAAGFKAVDRLQVMCWVNPQGERINLDMNGMMVPISPNQELADQVFQIPEVAINERFQAPDEEV